MQRSAEQRLLKRTADQHLETFYRRTTMKNQPNINPHALLARAQTT